MIVLAWFYVMSYLPDLQCEPDILPTHRLISLDDVTPVSLFALTIFHLVSCLYPHWISVQSYKMGNNSRNKYNTALFYLQLVIIAIASNGRNNYISTEPWN